MTTLNKKTLSAFVRLAANRLQGDWIIMGGSVLPLLGVEHRTTVDIDIAGPSQATMEQTLTLMELANELGLPIETINQAGAFFLQRIEDFNQQLILLRQGKTATIYRPNATLYILLKLPRFSESDLEDCLKFLEYADKQGETVDNSRLDKAISQTRRKGVSRRQDKRLQVLLESLRPAAE